MCTKDAFLPSSMKYCTDRKGYFIGEDNSHDTSLPFDLNDPQEAKDLHAGIICIISNTSYQYYFCTLKRVIIHVLTICMHHLHYLVGDDNIGLQDEEHVMHELRQEIGVNTDSVNIIFDQEELTDSDDEEF
jgi:hypothetical protein